MSPRNLYHSGPATDHFDGVRFFNNSPPTRDKSLRDLLRWRRTSRPAPWPERAPAALVTPLARSPATRITVVGHATVLIQTCGLKIVSDPVCSDRASPISFAGPKRVSPPSIAFDDLPPIDVVLLGHNHYDHLNVATLTRLVGRVDPVILTPLGNDAIVRRSIPSARLGGGDWWDRRRIADDVEVAFVPAQHWSARGVFDRRMALWCGFVVRAGVELIYFAGDTGYGDGSVFGAIRRRIGSPDVALLPIGAYAPRWFMGEQHVNPEEAIMIFEALQAQRAIGIHWGVLRLSDEGWAEPREAAGARVGRTKNRTRALSGGLARLCLECAGLIHVRPLHAEIQNGDPYLSKLRSFVRLRGGRAGACAARQRAAAVYRVEQLPNRPDPGGGPDHALGVAAIHPNLEPGRRLRPLARVAPAESARGDERPGGRPECTAWTFGGKRLIVFGLQNRVPWRADGGG
jgi:L-ascorbate metabolism protein UlaG (beta-lactamase superfamily)